jgi:septal ring-binding cell division protein DamX
MAWFLGQHRIAGDNAVHYGERGGRQWLVLFHGIYRTLGQALAAAGSLPADLAAQKPWARRIPTAGRLEPL